ncbi:MAG: hypothetical protein ACE14L_05425 [Terriglobales bacterium]
MGGYFIYRAAKDAAIKAAGKPYEAKFHWEFAHKPVPQQMAPQKQKSEPDEWSLKLKEIEVLNVPGEGGHPFHELASAYSQAIQDEVGKGLKYLLAKPTHLAPCVPNKVQLEADEFLCLDVGSWLADHQNFGLISNKAVFLCDYNPGSAAASPGAAKGIAKEFLENVPGCSIQRGPIKVGLPGMSNDELYVVIPDMHIPQTAETEIARARYRLWERIVEKVYVRPGEPPLFQAAYWSARRAAGEYGGARNFLCGLTGIEPMRKFLAAIRQFAGKTAAKQLTILQVGDMYELWAYRPCLFGDSGNDVAGPLVVNQPAAVAEWIAGTHFLFQEMFAEFDKCANAGIRLAFVHGNHDCYLLDKGVREKANSWLNDLPRFAELFDMTAEFAPVGFIPSTVPDRQACFDEHGIHAEHAHNHYDVSNHDGAASGQKFTDFGAHVGDLAKQFDSLRRSSFIAGAAALFVSNPFNIYVMGHTHGMDVNQVRVTHWLDGKQVKVTTEKKRAACAAP